MPSRSVKCRAQEPGGQEHTQRLTTIGKGKSSQVISTQGARTGPRCNSMVQVCVKGADAAGMAEINGRAHTINAVVAMHVGCKQL